MSTIQVRGQHHRATGALPQHLLSATVPDDIWLAAFQEDLQRDPVTTRRSLLLSLLWDESYQTQHGLMARVETRLGPGCFGKAALATFQRDMRAVRTILAASGHELRFSRMRGEPGYYIPGRPKLSPEIKDSIHAALWDIDRRQARMASEYLTPAQRLAQLGATSDSMRALARRQVHERQPGLTFDEARREVAKLYEQYGG